MAYKKAYEASMEIFHLTKTFPKEETYALISQIRRSSRSICANIAEGYRKRQYPNHFISKISDADMETSETIVWIEYSNSCGFINGDKKKSLIETYNEIGRLLNHMILHPENYQRKTGH